MSRTASAVPDAAAPIQRTALFAGTFDPVTLGHLDILRKALRLFDRVTVAVAIGRHKAPLFTVEERMEMFVESLSADEEARVAIRTFDGLLVDVARDVGALVVVRGLRFVSDFEFEMQMAELNRKLHPEVETVFLPPSEKYGAVNSTLIKQIAEGGGSLRDLVAPNVARRLRRRFRGQTPTRSSPTGGSTPASSGSDPRASSGSRRPAPAEAGSRSRTGTPAETGSRGRVKRTEPRSGRKREVR